MKTAKHSGKLMTHHHVAQRCTWYWTPASFSRLWMTRMALLSPMRRGSRPRMPRFSRGRATRRSRSMQMAMASRAARAGELARARAALVTALVVQAGFFAMQVNLFEDDLSKFQPQGSSYGSIYFTMLGAHLAHVAVGLLLVVWLLGKLARGLTNYRVVATQSIAFYWHFVNLLALLVVGAQLSARI